MEKFYISPEKRMYHNIMIDNTMLVIIKLIQKNKYEL